MPQGEPQEDGQLRELIASSRAGCRQSGAVLFVWIKNVLGPMLLSLCRKLRVSDDQLVEDAITHTFEQLTEGRFEYRSCSETKGWSVKVAERFVINHLRKKSTRLLNEKELVEENARSDGTVFCSAPGPCDAVSNAEVRNALALEIAKLRDPKRTILRMRFEMQLTAPQIAARLGLSSNSVNKHLQRARELLAPKLEKYWRDA